MRGFGWYYARAFIRPRRALDALAAEPRRLRYGAYAVAITATAYTLVYFFLSHNGGRPTVFRPWLAIDAEVYYHYNLYFHVPSLLLAWIAATGVAQLAARAVGGTGAFEDTLAGLGVGLSVASWWTALHDVVTTFLGFVGVIDQRAYEDAMNGATAAGALIWTLMTGYLVWFVLMFTKAMGASQQLRPAPAAAIGALAFVVYQLIFVLFNR
ncbi:MAG: hypothetical protein K8W52_09045 [Deltaproteobacteria bacterium]|nr:hypothetical protein [Deltaproteobacteria bacterium]